MRALTANDAISIWEQGQRQGAPGKSVTVLTAAFPETTVAELLGLTLGQCNNRLWQARNRAFGGEIIGFAACANCGERLEFSLDTSGLMSLGESSDEEFIFEGHGYRIRFRLLTLADLEAVSAEEDVGTARNRLLDRCVLKAEFQGEHLAASKLPEIVIEELGQRLAELDAGSEILIDLACPACKSSYQLPLDVASFFYTEISAQAQRLLREVHLLANAYGWQEQDILGMSSRRRQFYLQMLEV